MKDPSIVQFTNCRVLYNHSLVKQDLWIQNSKIVDAEKIFYERKISAGRKVDCGGGIVAPGFIDLELNGGWGLDFSENHGDIQDKISAVRKKILENGVTSFCPSLISSAPEVYKKVIPKIKRTAGGRDGASVLGIHLEGPFLNVLKKGAHNSLNLIVPKSNDLEGIYGDLENVSLVTLAPELDGAIEAVKYLTKRGIVVSLGHSVATLQDAEEGVRAGAKFVTHLYNAMPAFHARDPGLVGVIASDVVVREKRPLFYSLIADGHHASHAALRIAYRTHPKGAVLVTDAISALGLEDGIHTLGDQKMELKNGKATVEGTDTLCGSVAGLDRCLRVFHQAVDCSLVEALETVTLHPAQVLGIEKEKGTLEIGSDADLVLVDDSLNVDATFIGGECVFIRQNHLSIKFS